MASLIPRTKHEQVNAIISRLASLDVLKHFKEMRHLTNGTYEVYLSQWTMDSKTRANINSFTEIKTITLERNSVRVEIDFTEGQQVKTES